MNILGPRAIVMAVAYLLDNHIQQSIDEVQDEHLRVISESGVGNSVVIEKPIFEENQGLSFSATFNPKNRHNGLMIFVENKTDISNVINFGGPRSCLVSLGILWMVSDKLVPNIEVKKQLCIRILERCLMEYWHPVVNGNIFKCATHSVRFNPVSYQSGALRQSSGSNRTLRGALADTGDNIDGTMLGVSCVQRVYHPVKP